MWKITEVIAKIVQIKFLHTSVNVNYYPIYDLTDNTFWSTNVVNLYITRKGIPAHNAEKNFIVPFHAFCLFSLPSFLFVFVSLSSEPRNSRSLSCLRSLSASFFHSQHAFRSLSKQPPYRQIKLKSLTRHAGNRRIYLYLRTAVSDTPRIFLKFLLRVFFFFLVKIGNIKYFFQFCGIYFLRFYRVYISYLL